MYINGKQNSLGKIVLRKEIQSSNSKLDISSLPTGCYNFVIKNNEKVGATLFIKK